MRVFERKDDCPPVESFIWSKVCCSWGDFEGVEELQYSDLLALRSAVDHQLSLINQGNDADEYI